MKINPLNAIKMNISSRVLLRVWCSFAEVTLYWQVNCIVSAQQKKRIQKSMGGGEASEG